MNALEKQIVAHLKAMKSRFDIAAIKAEFEAEGTRFEELVRLKEIALSAGLGIILKIGGAEDVWGILQARRVGVAGIVAPMVESGYALSKFLAAAGKHIPMDEHEDILLAVNIETCLAHQNLDDMLKVAKRGELDAITLGRVDMLGSLGLGRSTVDSEEMCKVAEDVCSRSKRAGFVVTMGGSIEAGAFDTIRRFAKHNILDRFETRKIVFDVATADDQKTYESAIRAAHRFELLWLENKRNSYSTMANEDRDRIPMLKKRIEAEE